MNSIVSKDTFLAEAENIPLASDSIDVVVLPHVFEYSNNPHRLLRELDRILIDDGHLVILGINRFSLWGLWYVFMLVEQYALERSFNFNSTYEGLVIVTRL